MLRLSNLLPTSARAATQMVIQVALVAALFVTLQFLAGRHNVRFDLTPDKAFLLSAHAKQVAEAFDEPVRITVFYNSQIGGERRRMFDLLQQFRDAASHLTFRLVDLDRSPGLARKYGVSSYNSGIAEAGGQMVNVRGVDEVEITRVLLELSRDEERTLCFITGHGERRPADNDERSGYSDVAKALERERFRIQAVRTIPSRGVPENCDVVILAGPSHDLLPGEGDALARYLRGGGKVLLLVDPDAPPSVIEFLRDLGIEAGNDLIVDEQNRFIGADSFMPQVVRFRTDTFRDSLRTAAVFSLARTVRSRDEKPADVRIISIAATSPDSWALVGTSAAPDEEVRFRREVDRPGPLSVGVLATFERKKGDDDASTGGAPGELMVLGDSDFASNFYLNLLGNRDLLMSSVAILAEDPVLVGVRGDTARASIAPLGLTASQGRTIFWTAVVVLPGSCLSIGVLLAALRRRQKGGR